MGRMTPPVAAQKAGATVRRIMLMSVSTPATNISRTPPRSARILNMLETETPLAAAGASQCSPQTLSNEGPSRTPASNSPRTSGSPMRDAAVAASFAVTITTAMHKRIWSEIFTCSLESADWAMHAKPQNPWRERSPQLPEAPVAVHGENQSHQKSARPSHALPFRYLEYCSYHRFTFLSVTGCARSERSQPRPSRYHPPRWLAVA